MGVTDDQVLWMAKLALWNALNDKAERTANVMPCYEKNILMELGCDPDIQEYFNRKREPKEKRS